MRSLDFKRGLVGNDLDFHKDKLYFLTLLSYQLSICLFIILCLLFVGAPFFLNTFFSGPNDGLIVGFFTLFWQCSNFTFFFWMIKSGLIESTLDQMAELIGNLGMVQRLALGDFRAHQKKARFWNNFSTSFN